MLHVLNASSLSNSKINKKSGQAKSTNASDPNKPPKPEDNTTKFPVYPHTPVKVYSDASVFKSDMLKDFKKISIIYMWFNKITGKVYIGSGSNGSGRLGTYYQPSILKNKSLIYKNILKYGHANFSVHILWSGSDMSIVPKSDLLAKEKFYLDWALKTYGLDILNMLNLPGSSQGYKHTKESLLKMSELKKGDLNPMYNKAKSDAFLILQAKGKHNPRFGQPISKEELANRYKKIYVYNSQKEFIKSCASVGLAVKDLHISARTLRKYLNSDILYKGMYIYSKLQ